MKYRQLSRRKLLKASIGGAALPFALNTALATTTEESSEVVHHYRGSWDDPLDIAQMMQTKRQTIDRHIKQGGTVDGYFDAVPNFPDGAKLVDYVVRVQSNGIPTQHVSIAGNRKSVQRAHQDADERAQELRASTEEPSTAANWNHRATDTATFKDCPYGEIKHNFRWEERDPAAVPSGKEVHKLRQNASMNPGTLTCNSRWGNEWQRVEQRWESSAFNNVALFDSDPDGGGGTVSVSIGYGGASASWSFNTGGNIDKYINGENVRWDVDGFALNERKVTQEMEPASVIIMDDPSCGKQYFTYLETEGHFQHVGGPKYELWYSWDVSYTPC